MNKETFFREKFILYNVLNKEIVFQEYFCNLLYFDDFRECFLEFIKFDKKQYSEIEYCNFTTEKILNKNNIDYGRADLFLKNGTDEYIFEIKNKCYTTLTEKQPIYYLDYLTNTNENLFFFIPRKYLHTKEIYSKWENKNHFKNISRQILFWEDFIILLKDKKIYETSTEINMFYEFCLYWFNLKPISFTKEERELSMNKSIPILLEKIEETIDQIGINCNMKIDNNTVGYNYSISINNHIIYLGTDYVRWKEKNEVISLSLQSIKNSGQEFDLNLPFDIERVLYEETSKSYKQFAYYFNLEVKIDDEKFVDNVTKLINELLKELKKEKI